MRYFFQCSILNCKIRVIIDLEKLYIIYRRDCDENSLMDKPVAATKFYYTSYTAASVYDQPLNIDIHLNYGLVKYLSLIADF